MKMISRFKKRKHVKMTHAVMIKNGDNQSIIAETPTKGMADQLVRALKYDIESDLVVEPLKKHHGGGKHE